MTIAGAVAGFLAAMAAFWVLGRMTGDNWYAMAAGLGVFAFGTLAAGEGAISEILFENGFSYPYFPGFRRYIPAMGFPAFFMFVGLIWKLVSRQWSVAGRQPPVQGVSTTPSAEADATPPNQGEEFKNTPSIADNWLLTTGYCLLSVACFAFCVFTYFYIWTTAAAFLGCVVLVWSVERPEGWQRDLKTIAAVGAGCIVVLVPYAYLLSQRGETMDHVQLLVNTRMPDFFRFPEYVSFTVLIILIVGLATKLLDLKDRMVLFTLALSLVAFVIFNQQVITGRSLQPIHYQVFIGNYVSVLALFAAVGVLWKSRLGHGRTVPKIACAGIFFVAIFWGFVECHYTVRVLDEANVERDKALSVGRRLEQLAANHFAPHRITVLSLDGIFADDMPTVAPQNILWARHQHVFAGLSWEESKERYYQQLYYTGADTRTLDWLLRIDFVSQIALFGWGRHTDRLSVDSKPLTYGEIAEEVRRYGAYIQDFSREKASNPLLSYVVIRSGDGANLEKLEKWYVLDEGETVGEHTIYSVRLR
jgi:hypothetical protein